MFNALLEIKRRPDCAAVLSKFALQQDQIEFFGELQRQTHEILDLFYEGGKVLAYLVVYLDLRK